MGVPLRHMDLGQDHLHVSVHLPYKRGRNAACQLLQEYLEDNQGHYNYIHIHGDFNSGRDVLQGRFAALDPTFAFDAVTTKAGGKRDNVVSLWDKTIFENQYVQTDTIFSHTQFMLRQNWKIKGNYCPLAKVYIQQLKTVHTCMCTQTLVTGIVSAVNNHLIDILYPSFSHLCIVIQPHNASSKFSALCISFYNPVGWLLLNWSLKNKPN